MDRPWRFKNKNPTRGVFDDELDRPRAKYRTIDMNPITFPPRFLEPKLENPEYRSLCVSGVSSKVPDRILKDQMYREFEKYGEMNVNITYNADQRVAYINFKYPEDARAAKHDKYGKLVVFDRPVRIESVYNKIRSSSPPPPTAGYPERNHFPGGGRGYHHDPIGRGYPGPPVPPHPGPGRDFHGPPPPFRDFHGPPDRPFGGPPRERGDFLRIFGSGNVTIVDTLMRDPTSTETPALTIKQRLRLDPSKTDDVQKRVVQSGPRNHCVLIAFPSTLDNFDDPGRNIQQRPLKNLVSYLKQKEAAGVISLPPYPTKDKDNVGLLHAFPPCQFGYEYLLQRAPKLPADCMLDDYIVVVVVRGAA
ncbi:LOW QUALITY PROTEIN: RNA-binding protein spenito-like [Ruditapes philippinarum]|uniref:LOW QUALITY PROTEIN: RNA-binding protein spenito-like n=1 Tax=Ruditapes philippinarum TaxID=129788 RepID=UPI00295BDF56|nr:LOW QUALITY PROTEIN: RNA-binding protein spenito-like [Ruditapes philippinarum]